MVERTQSPQGGRLRPGRAQDEDAVRSIADEVFTVFGEYGSWLPGYLTHPGVWSYIYEERRDVVGFALLGILEPDERQGGRLADLLAIAVRASHQGRGIGTMLLKQVVEKARYLRHAIDLREVRLTVAEPNERARRFFVRFGFLPIEGDHGYYDKGQRALRLGLKLHSNQ